MCLLTGLWIESDGFDEFLADLVEVRAGGGERCVAEDLIYDFRFG